MHTRDSSAWATFGPLGAIALGILLVPLREMTPASNFTFAFIALTILAAEFGGAWPALATAVLSALSLDFFLTKPYLRLAIEDKHDIIAVVGFAACGLLTSALSSWRNSRVRRLLREREPASAAPAGDDDERRLESEMRLQSVRRSRLRWTEAAVVASLPIWLQPQLSAPGFVAWLALVGEGFCLVMATSLTLIEAHFRRAAESSCDDPRVILHLPWTRWDDARSALWGALALACVPPWAYGVFGLPLPGHLATVLVALAVSLLVVVVMTETLSTLRVRWSR